MQKALGEMGMTSHDFYCMTWAEVALSFRGYLKKQCDYIVPLRRLGLIIESTKPGSGILPQEEVFWPLPTDKANIMDEDAMTSAWKYATKNGTGT